MTWTIERVRALTKPEVRQLRVNAERLRKQEVVTLCDEVLGERAKLKPRKRPVQQQQ